MLTSFRFIVLLLACLLASVQCFVPARGRPTIEKYATWHGAGSFLSTSRLRMAEEFVQESPEGTKARIQALVDKHPVLLFMKGSKLFPQCGFSNTATQILMSYSIDFHTVDVLSDDAIRQGVKDFSQWPTIPQLYVAGEFIGGSDIMIEMYQNGELGEMIEKAKAEMM